MDSSGNNFSDSELEVIRYLAVIVFLAQKGMRQQNWVI